MSSQFFISCPIGFEEALALEIQSFWGLLIDTDGRTNTYPVELKIQKGGVFLEAPWHLGVQINFFSKLAHRVLLRLKSFKCVQFGDLFYKIKEVQIPVADFKVEIAASESKLNNEKKILEVLEKSWKNKIKESSDHRLYIRVAEDIFTISLDTTGEHLHKRGYKKMSSEAPLRETIASFVLQKIIGSSSAAELKNIHLIDPMAGSGTFLFEAATLYEPNLRRAFSFQKIPGLAKILKSESLKNNYFFQKESPFKALTALDIDESMLKVIADNNEALKVQIHIEQKDLFKNQEAKKGINWVVVNPPYGERLSLDFAWIDFLTAIKNNFNPERAAVLVSQKSQSLFEKALISSGFKNLESTLINNGGIKVVLYNLIRK